MSSVHPLPPVSFLWRCWLWLVLALSLLLTLPAQAQLVLGASAKPSDRAATPHVQAQLVVHAP